MRCQDDVAETQKGGTHQWGPLPKKVPKTPAGDPGSQVYGAYLRLPDVTKSDALV